jgi:hypothetical protein
LDLDSKKQINIKTNLVEKYKIILLDENLLIQKDSLKVLILLILGIEKGN